MLAQLRGDKAIWAIIVILGVFSLLAVYSSTGTLAYRYRGGNTEAFLMKHSLILIGGLILTYICHRMHYMAFNKAAPVMLTLSIPLLFYTIVYGADINDARRWIEIPLVGITFQTSDFAKIALVIYVARALTIKQDYIKDFKGAFVPIIVPILIICSLIAPADLSTALMLFFTTLLMMVVGRVKLPYVAVLFFMGLMMFSVLVAMGDFFPEVVRSETWVNRLRDFLVNPDGTYQVQQAKIAIGNGEWLGLGPGNSIQRNYLPNSFSDFIYAIICEEYGLVGGVIIILLYVVLFFRITRLVTKSPKAFGALAAIGLGLLLTLQAFANVAVAVHLVPVTGLTLPMVSMGGTSVLFTCIAFGIILSISKYIESIAS